MAVSANTGQKLTIGKVSSLSKVLMVQELEYVLLSMQLLVVMLLQYSPTFDFDIEYDEFHVVKTIHRQ